MLKKNVSSFLSPILFIILFFILNTLQAQVQNEGELYIGDNGIFYVGAGEYNFGLGSTSTCRNKSDFGVLSFSNEASWNNASDAYFADGYVQNQSNTSFIFPIGQSGVYAPIQVVSSNSECISAAYFGTAPNIIGSILDGSIKTISSVEYWNFINSDVNAGISLSWRSSSAVSDLTNASLPNLTIVGWNGSSWIAIPSIVDEYSILGEISSLDSGSIRSKAEVDLSKYSAFTLGNLLKESKLDKIQLTTYINKNRLFIESSLPITALNIYDITGKKMFSGNLNGDLKYDRPFNFADEMYIITIELDNGASLITRKILNKN